MNRNAASDNTWLWLTFPIAVLLALAAGVGLFTAGLYRDTPGLVAQAIGQDIVTLIVALPALVISALLASRGSQRARLVWLGVLVYVVYTYASYAFGIRFNPLFLAYVALLGCSTYALIGGLLTTDRSRHESGLRRAHARESGEHLPAGHCGRVLFDVVERSRSRFAYRYRAAERAGRRHPDQRHPRAGYGSAVARPSFRSH